MVGARTEARQGVVALLTQATLVCLLLAQLGVLWVVAHTSPTRLPPGAVGAVAELFAGRLDFDCREASVDRRGWIRLGGVRLHDSLNPDDALVCDVDLLPDWGACLRAQPSVARMQARGRASLGAGAGSAAVDDFVVRIWREDSALAIQSAARAGSMVLRADASLTHRPLGKRADEAAWPSWNRELAADALRCLRALDGNLCLSAARGVASAEGSFIDNPSAAGPLPFRTGQGWLRARWDGELSGGLSLLDVRGPDTRAGHLWVSLGKNLRLRAIADEICFGAVTLDMASAEGSWRPNDGATLRLRAASAESHVSSDIELGRGVTRAREIAAHLSAADLLKVAPLAQAARAAGIDLCGTVDLDGGEATWTGGELASARGSVALSKAGWQDIRPALVRPGSARAAFTGDFDLDLEQGRLALRRLDLAGIRGDIECGIRAGDPFVIRLASSPDNPVNPSCLNSLLGDWWIQLWSRFDLSTEGVRPHAEVRVAGRWGASETVRTDVRARLERFGFMGARFLRTDLWVRAEATETRVRINELRGELQGKDAGAVRASVRWDWQRPEWGGQPEIEAEGDLSPICALRLHDAAIATRIGGWTFGEPRLHVMISPGRPLSATLEATGASNLGGVEVKGLRLNVGQKAAASTRLLLEATGELCGGKAALYLEGDLASQNDLRFSIREWSRSGLEALVSQLGGPPQEQAAPDASKLTVLYSGTYDFSAPWNTKGKGRANLADPSLKTIHLLGGLSKGFDALGIGFSSYSLDKADVVFSCENGQAQLGDLRIEGDDAEVKLKGAINLRNGGLNLSGQIYLKDSPWGFLKYINPNRLIAKMIKINVVGDISNPDVRTNTLDVKIYK